MVASITRADLQDEFHSLGTTLQHELHKEFLKVNMRLESLELSFAVPEAQPGTGDQRLCSSISPPCPPQPGALPLQASQRGPPTVLDVEIVDFDEDRLPLPASNDMPIRTGINHASLSCPSIKQRATRPAMNHSVTRPSNDTRGVSTRSVKPGLITRSKSRSDDHEWTNHHFRSFKTGQEARFWNETTQTSVKQSKMAKRMSTSSSVAAEPDNRKVAFGDAKSFKTFIANEHAFKDEPETTLEGKFSFQGLAQQLVSSTYFSSAIAFCIFANALTIGIQADVMAREKLEDDPTVFRIIELLFCAVFTLEIIVKLIAYRLRYFCMAGWRWNIFDFFLVSMQLTEEILEAFGKGAFSNLSAMRVLRVLRVVRIIRVIRLLRMISELRAIVASVAGSMRALGWTVLLLYSIIYILSVYCTQLLIEERISRGADSELPELSHLYGSVGDSILTLYQSVSGGVDWDNAVRPLMKEVHPLFGMLFSLYIAFTILAILNVVTGVFVESALKSAREDQDIYIVNHIRGLIDNMTTGNDGTISWDNFQAKLSSEDMAEVFKVIDVDMKEAAGLFRLLDLNGNGEVDSEEFLDGCLRLRGPAKALDMALLMREIKQIRDSQEEFLLVIDNENGGAVREQQQDELLRQSATSANYVLSAKEDGFGMIERPTSKRSKNSGISMTSC